MYRTVNTQSTGILNLLSISNMQIFTYPFVKVHIMAIITGFSNLYYHTLHTHTVIYNPLEAAFDHVKAVYTVYIALKVLFMDLIHRLVWKLSQSGVGPLQTSRSGDVSVRVCAGTIRYRA